MAYDEFLNTLADAGLINDALPERDAIICFVQSMMTQIDEIDNERHMKMQLLEYFEAISRAADGLSLTPPDAIPEEWTWELRQKQPLCNKLNNMIPALFNIAKKEFREHYRRPDKDPTTGLFIDTQNLDQSFFVAKT